MFLTQLEAEKHFSMLCYQVVSVYRLLTKRLRLCNWQSVVQFALSTQLELSCCMSCYLLPVSQRLLGIRTPLTHCTEVLQLKFLPHFSLSARPSQSRHQSELSCGWWSHATRSHRWALGSAWSLICFACSGQSSHQGNIIRQWGRSCNEKHSDGQKCPEVSVMSQWSLPLNE